mgnify:CR=1 FL=1
MNVLAIGAHFDDIELGCGGAIAKHNAQGDKILLYVATDSGYTNYAREVIRKPEIARKEGELAGKILGVNDLICGNFVTNDLQFNDELVMSIRRIIDEYEIDTIYSHWNGDVHMDHQNVSKAALSAARHVKKVLMYRSNFYDSPSFFRGNFYVDISEFINKKVEAVKAHASEYERAGEIWLKFILNQNQNDGQKINAEYAECFEVVRYYW